MGHKDKEKARQYARDYYFKNKEAISANRNSPENLKKALERKVLSSRRSRKIALSAYGGKCVCCGEDTFEFLQFDHIHNNGAAHRREIGVQAGKDFVRWLRKNNYPKDIIQILCSNCNLAKGYYGQCPHGNM